MDGSDQGSGGKEANAASSDEGDDDGDEVEHPASLSSGQVRVCAQMIDGVAMQPSLSSATHTSGS